VYSVIKGVLSEKPCFKCEVNCTCISDNYSCSLLLPLKFSFSMIASFRFYICDRNFYVKLYPDVFSCVTAVIDAGGANRRASLGARGRDSAGNVPPKSRHKVFHLQKASLA
jgi:hypothetical protein